MRNTVKIFIPLLALILVLSNFSFEPKKNFVFMSFGDTPVLPSTSYRYSNVDMPKHLSSPPPNSGYNPVNVDRFAFNDIDDEVATLGRVLFYDKKLSALENISCASCHLQSKSFADEGEFSEGLNLPTKRNAMHLNDMAWSNNERFFWDMSESNLRTMISLPLKDENEIGANMNDVVLKMDESSYYPQLFHDAFGSTLIDEEGIVEALSQFIMSMHTFNSKFDKEAEREFIGLSDSEMRGLELFGENCSSCHSQGAHDISELTGGSNTGTITQPALQVFPNLFNNGLEHDPEDLGAGEWRPDKKDLFKIPTLRNIELTGPYMHDGRFETLEEVLDHYDSNVISNQWSIGLIPDGGFGFGEQGKKDIIAFLKILTDTEFTVSPFWSDPFDITDGFNDEQLLDMLIKPNPLSSFSIIEFENKGSKPAIINTFNSNGQLIKSDRVTSTTYEINKADFDEGMYFIEITIGDRKQTQKLIVH